MQRHAQQLSCRFISDEVNLICFISESMTQITTDKSLRNEKLSDPHLRQNGIELSRIEQRQRIEHVHDACAETVLFGNQIYKRKHNRYYFSAKYNFSYCKVPKIGSSFWAYVFTILQNGKNVTEKVFGMARDAVHRNSKSRQKAFYSSEEIYNFRSVLVSRDPYSRLFSAFVDKLFLPLNYHVSQTIAEMQQSLPKRAIKCVNNVTFPGFLNYIVENVAAGKALDLHWAPVVSLCDPCNVNIFALVKQESFSPDVEYILKELKIEEQEFQLIFDALHDRQIDATIPGIIKSVLKKRSRSKKCLTHIEVARRLWVSFQIQGYLRDDVPFPFDIVNTEEKADSPEFLINLTLNTIRKNPLTSIESKIQRSRALETAFKTIGEETIKGIQEVYRQDFILFDYSFEPPSKNGFAE